MTEPITHHSAKPVRGFLAYLDSMGKTKTIDTGAVRFVGDVGQDCSIIIASLGQIIFSRTSYSELMGQLESIQGYIKTYDILQVFQGGVVLNKEPEGTEGYHQYGTVASHTKGNQETH